MITWTEIRSILRSVLRWWWVIVLSVAVASGVAFYVSGQETRFYVAHTSLRIGNTLNSQLPDPNQMSVGVALARYYGELARREPILGAVQKSLNLPFSWALISDRMLMTNVVPSANLLEIYITDSNPERAAAIANAIGIQLIAFSPTSPEKIAAEQQAIEQQIIESDQKIKDFQNKITELKIDQEAATSASDLAEISQKIILIEASLAQEQSSYKGLLNYKNSSAVNSLSVFEPATPPLEPLPSKRKIIVGIAGLAGLMLALAAIYVLEKFDSRLRGPRENKARFQVDDLGTVPIGPPLLVATEPFAQERLGAARNAQTNILLAAADRSAHVLMITSPQPSEARTNFSIDLADLFGRSGHRVLLVDADFTASLLTQMLTQSGVAQMWTVASNDQRDNLWAHLRPTALENVTLLPGKRQGGVPAMIPSLRWRELVDHLFGSADVIIFDGPATLSGPDAALLAPHVDGVVLTLDPTIDNSDDLARSRERLLHQKGTRLLGAVTFVQAKRPGRPGGLRNLLRSRRIPALPDSGGQVTPVADINQREPLITPVADINQHEPLITPVVDVVPINHAYQLDDAEPLSDQQIMLVNGNGHQNGKQPDLIIHTVDADPTTQSIAAPLPQHNSSADLGPGESSLNGDVATKAADQQPSVHPTHKQQPTRQHSKKTNRSRNRSKSS